MAPIEVSQDTLDWLCSGANPPVRYLALTRLLGRSESDRQVRPARACLGEYAPTRRIPAARSRIWRFGADLYQKYRGGHCQLTFPAEHLAPPDLPGVAQAVEFDGTAAVAFEPLTFIEDWPYAWIDSMGTMIRIGEGTCDASGKTITFRSDFLSPFTNQKTCMTSVYKVEGPDRYVHDMFGPGADGKEFQMVELVHTRKK